MLRERPEEFGGVGRWECSIALQDLRSPPSPAPAPSPVPVSSTKHDDAVAHHSVSHLKQDYLLFIMSLLDDEVYRNRIAACLRAICATRYVREDNVPCQIEEGLFLGSVGAAHNRDALKALNITHILIVAKSLEPAHPNDFIYKKIEVLDSPDVDLEQYFDECIKFIDEAKGMGGGVLVHCFAGRSRSVTIVVAYLMKKHHMSLSQALTLVRDKRPHVAPNHGFLEQLTNFEQSLQVNQDAKAC